MQNNTGKSSKIMPIFKSLSNIVAGIQKTSSIKDYTRTQLANISSAIENYDSGADTLYKRYKQEKELAAFNLQSSILDNLKRKGIAQTSAAESGVSGNSITSLFRGYDRADAVNKYMAAYNMQNLTDQFNENLEGLKTKALNAVYNIEPYVYNYNNSYDFDINSLKNAYRELRNINWKKGLRIDTREALEGDVKIV